MNKTHAYIRKLDKIKKGRISPMAKICHLTDILLELKENPGNLSHEELKTTAILTMRVTSRL